MITTSDLIINHCTPGTRIGNNKIPVERVRERPLRSVLWMRVKLEGYKKGHVATKSHKILALDYLQP